MPRLSLNILTGAIVKGAKHREPRISAVASERAKSGSAMAKARKLAQSRGVQIEKDPVGGWWVTCAALASCDPLDGNNFCASGAEVLDAVQVYVQAIEASKPSGANAVAC